MRKFLALFLTAVAVLSACPPSAVAQVNAIFKTSDELVAYLPITNASAYDYQVVYSIGPLTLSPGQIVDLRLQMEFTTQCPENVGLGRYIVRSNSPLSTSGTIVSKAAMSNLTPDEHHEVVSSSTLDPISDYLPNVYYNVVAYAASSWDSCIGSSLTVEGFDNDNYGELSLEVR